jgi:YD repeat-containing protein
MPHFWKRGSQVLCGLILSYAVFNAACVSASQYTYDAQNRLKTVANADGTMAEYVYDVSGNLLEVRRSGPSDLAIASFFPTSGPIGTQVTINGSGFSPTPSGNALTFGGTAAVPDASTPTTLSVAVPAGAATGPIGVTANGQTAQTSKPFTVTADNGAPTITSFTPTCVPVDQVVTLTGTNFDSRPDATRVEVGEQVAVSSVSSPTNLTFKAPRFTAGGKIHVVTAAGVAESADPLAVWPSSLNCSTWGVSFWTSVDAPAINVAMTQAHYAAIYFTGRRDQLVSYQGYDIAPSANYIGYVLFSPKGVQLVAGQFGPNSGYSAHFPPLPTTGTYELRLYPNTATNVTLNAQLESARELVADGPSSNISVAQSHTKRVAFSADASSSLGIGINPLSSAVPHSNGGISTFLAPDRTGVVAWPSSVYTCADNNPVCRAIVPPLQQDGLYSFLWGMSNGSATDASIWLSNDVVPMLAPGAHVPIVLQRFGRNARLQFHGVAGSGVSIDIADLQLSQGSTSVWVYGFSPTNQQLGSAEISTRSLGAGGGMVTLPFLLETGTYTVLVSPDKGGFATFTATLDPGIPLIVDGPVLDVSTSSPGEGIRLVVDGVVDQKIGVGLTALSANASVYVYMPDGTPFTNFFCPKPIAPAPGCDIDLGALPLAGRYAITIQPQAPATAITLKAQASNDVVVAGTGSPQTLAVGRYGSNGRVTLQGVPGAGQTIQFSNLATTPPGIRVWITLLKPDGTVVPSTTPQYHMLDLSGNTGTMKIGDFPIRGTYTAFLDPFNAALVSTTVQLSAGVDVIGAGQVAEHKDVVPGPWARATFVAQPGDHFAVGLDVQSLTNPTGSTVTLSVFDPNGMRVPQRGTTTFTSSCNATTVGGCDFDMPEVYLSGEYQVLAELPVTKPEDATVQLSVTEDIVLNGTSGTFNLATRGQNGRLIFAGTAGHQPRITLTRTSPVGAGRDVVTNIYAADGTRVAGGTMSGTQTTQTYLSPALPATGDYMLHIDPSSGYTTTLNAVVESP